MEAELSARGGRAAAPLKIACFEAGFDSWYGAQQSLATLLNSLPASVHATIVTTRAGVLSAKAEAAGLPVHILEGGDQVSVSGMTRARPGPRQVLTLLRGMVRVNLSALLWVRQAGIDVLYANNARALTYFLLPALLLRKPVVWYVRIDQRIRGLFALALCVADRVVCITEAVRERAFTPRERQRHAGKLTVLWTGFHLPASRGGDTARDAVRRALGVVPGERLLLTVGSISQRKGHDVLVDAFIRVASAHSGVRLAIAGDPAPEAGEFQAGLQRQLQAAGLAARVHWLGYRADVLDLYAAADIVVLASRAEGLPRVVPEALSMGRPIVASDAGGTRELLADPRFGTVVDPLTAPLLANALAARLADPDLDAPAAIAARRTFVAERLSVSAYRDGFLRILDEIR